MEVYAEQKYGKFTRVKFTIVRGTGSFTYELNGEDAQHLYDVLTGKCGVIETRTHINEHPPREAVYASRLHAKGELTYIIEPK